MEIEIGRGKKARQAYGFDDIAIVPSRRSRRCLGLSASRGGSSGGDRDRARQEGAAGVRVRRHRDRALQEDARPAGRRHRLEARPAPARAAFAGLGDGRRRLAAGRDRARQARRARRAQPGGDLHALRAGRGSAPEDREAVEGAGHARDARDLRAARRAEADRPADRGDQGGRRARGRGADAAEGARPLRARAGGRARRARDPGHGRLGRARLLERPRAQPEGVHLLAADPDDRRRLRLVPDGAAPDAHRGRGRARRRRAGAGVHDARRARGRRPAGDCDRGRGGGSGPAPARDRQVRERDRRRRHAHRRRHLEGDRLRRRRRDGRLAARPREGSARPWLPLGHGDVPSDLARAVRAWRSTRTRRWRRS